MKQKLMNTLHIVTLLSAPGVGRRTVQQILDTNLAFAPSRPQELRDILLEASTRSPRMRVPSNAELEKAYNNAEMIMESAEHLGVKVIGPDSPTFPDSLRTIPDPPVVLYARGNIACLSTQSAVAIIGTREPSTFGLAAAERIGAVLAGKGLVIVSGLALGCDAAAHLGCLKSNGHAVAVLAHGLDNVYPAQNRDLASHILDSNGCLISEYPPGTKPRGNFFIERDRLQSGLSAAVIVIETDVKGGTMHTAHFCLKQQRLLGCLVHPPKFASHAKARGNQKLIAEENAFPLSTKEDMDKFLHLFVPAPPQLEADLSLKANTLQEKSGNEQLQLFQD
jgi:DNA processing protein